MPTPHSALLSLPDLLKLDFGSMDEPVGRAWGGRLGRMENTRAAKRPDLFWVIELLSYNNPDATTMPCHKHLPSSLPKPPPKCSSSPPSFFCFLASSRPCGRTLGLVPPAQPQASKSNINHSFLFPVRTGSLRLFTDLEPNPPPPSSLLRSTNRGLEDPSPGLLYQPYFL